MAESKGAKTKVIRCHPPLFPTACVRRLVLTQVSSRSGWKESMTSQSSPKTLRQQVSLRPRKSSRKRWLAATRGSSLGRSTTALRPPFSSTLSPGQFCRTPKSHTNTHNRVQFCARNLVACLHVFSAFFYGVSWDCVFLRRFPGLTQRVMVSGLPAGTRKVALLRIATRSPVLI